LKGKTASTAIIISTLLFLAVAGTQVVEVAKANPSSTARLFDNVVITIQSPQNASYNVKTIPINFTVESNNDYQLPVNYTLNGKKLGATMTTVVSQRTVNSWYGWYSNDVFVNNTYSYARFTAQGDALLSNLADGTYNLTIQRFGNPSKPVASTNVTFTIDTISPSIQILLPQNKSYDITSVPLVVALTEPSTLTYSLDEKANVTIIGNATLTGVPAGLHSLRVYANDAAGNTGVSDTVEFTFQPNLPAPTASPSSSSTQQPPASGEYSPNPLLIVSAFVAAVIAFATSGLTVYYRKQKRMRKS
jgi:hypothetical protein